MRFIKTTAVEGSLTLWVPYNGAHALAIVLSKFDGLTPIALIKNKPVGCCSTCPKPGSEAINENTMVCNVNEYHASLHRKFRRANVNKVHTDSFSVILSDCVDTGLN